MKKTKDVAAGSTCGVFCKTTAPPTLSHVCPTPDLGAFSALHYHWASVGKHENWVLSLQREQHKRVTIFWLVTEARNLRVHLLISRGEQKTQKLPSLKDPPALAHIPCLPPWRTAWNITYNKQIMPKMFIKHYYFKIKTLSNLVAIYIASPIP